MYRIKYLLGSLIAIFSLVYFLFGIVGWIRADMSNTDMLTCFVLGSLHVMGGGYLLVSSLRDYRAERTRMDAIVRQIIRSRAGRVAVSDLAHMADIPEDDAREYLERRARYDVVFHLEGRNGRDTYYFGQEFWNN